MQFTCQLGMLKQCTAVAMSQRNSVLVEIQSNSDLVVVEFT